MSCSLKDQFGESLETRFLELGWRDGLRVGLGKPVFVVNEELSGVCKWLLEGEKVFGVGVEETVVGVWRRAFGVGVFGICSWQFGVGDAVFGVR